MNSNGFIIFPDFMSMIMRCDYRNFSLTWRSSSNSSLTFHRYIMSERIVLQAIARLQAFLKMYSRLNCEMFCIWLLLTRRCWSIFFSRCCINIGFAVVIACLTTLCFPSPTVDVSSLIVLMCHRIINDDVWCWSMSTHCDTKAFQITTRYWHSLFLQTNELPITL